MCRRNEMNDGRECDVAAMSHVSVMSHVAAVSHVSAIGNKGTDATRWR